MAGGTGIGVTYSTYKERSAAPSTPGAYYDRLFFMADGLHYINSAGANVLVSGSTEIADERDFIGVIPA
jgi:hypothetical protein